MKVGTKVKVKEKHPNENLRSRAGKVLRSLPGLNIFQEKEYLIDLGNRT